MKVAVIGSGAAAAGVLAGLERFAPRDVEVSVFDIGSRLHDPPPGQEERGLSDDAMSPMYQRMRAEHGLSFPPPKTHFGESLTMFSVENKPLLWRSEHRGGLTNVWGGGMFPYTDRELAGWPVTARDLDPHYRIMADQVGVCGEPDALNRYFATDYVNRPAFRTSPVIRALAETVNSHGGAARHGWTIHAGSSRLALETRPGHARTCVYSGECMLGCPRGSIWSASQDLDRLQSKGFLRTYVRGRVLAVGNQRIRYRAGSGGPGGPEASAGPFDRIYLAAGCIGTTEIVMRSLGITSGPTMVDNAVLSFPIFHLGRQDAGEGGYFSLCNLSMMGVPDDAAEAAAQVSIYPAFDHLWRYYTPEPLWASLRDVWRRGRWRFLIGRVFFAGDANPAYNLALEDDALVLRFGRKPDIRSRARTFMRAMRRATNHSGFMIPPAPPLRHGTSTHYGTTFPYGGTLAEVRRDGRIAPGVHVADATAFVSMPSISPTFTIMANACRTVYESLET